MPGAPSSVLAPFVASFGSQRNAQNCMTWNLRTTPFRTASIRLLLHLRTNVGPVLSPKPSTLVEALLCTSAATVSPFSQALPISFSCLFFNLILYMSHLLSPSECTPHGLRLFPTCQVRVVRFYVSSCSLPPSPPGPLLPELQTQEGSEHCRTSTTSSRGQ